MEIKIKYYWRSLDGKSYVTTTPIDCLEGNGDKPFLGNSAWELVARCLFTGLQDKRGSDIFVRDRIMHAACEWEVKFGFHKIVLMDEQYWEYAYGFFLEKELGVSIPIDQNTANESVVIGNAVENK